jgi:hypothetical protein
MEVIFLQNIVISKNGIYFRLGPGLHIFEEWADLNGLAFQDGIDPPTGIELGRVLKTYHIISPNGLDGQIIRWRYEEETP